MSSGSTSKDRPGGLEPTLGGRNPDDLSDATLFYGKWIADRTFLLVPAQAIVGEFLKSFQRFPPRQRPASFSIDQALENARESEKQLANAVGGGVK